MPRLKLLSLVASLAIAATSCGGNGDTVSPEDYAADICTSIGRWASDIQERVGGLAEVLTPGTSPEQGKEALASLLDGAVSDTEKVVTAIEEAGVPDVDDGEEIADGLKEALAQVKVILEEARADVDELPSEPAQFQEAATAIQEKMNESFGSVGSELGDLESPDLEQAFSEAEQCTSIAG